MRTPAFALWILLTPWLFAADPSGEALLAEVDRMSRATTGDWSIVFDVIDEKTNGPGKKVTRLGLARRDSAQALFLWDNPENRSWELRRGEFIDRHEWSEVNRGWIDQRFRWTITDLDRFEAFTPTDYGRAFGVEALTSGVLGKFPTWVLSLVPKSSSSRVLLTAVEVDQTGAVQGAPQEVAVDRYRRAVLTLHKEAKLPMKLEYFDSENRPALTIVWTGYRKILDTFVAGTRIEVDQENQTKKQYHLVSVDARDLSNLFSPEWLRSNPKVVQRLFRD